MGVKVLDKTEIINELIENMDTLKEFGVARIGLFGSFARDEQNENSDIDILVDFADGFVTFDNYMELKYYLKNLFQRKVDIVRTEALKPEIKNDVLRSVVYANKRQKDYPIR